MMKDDTNSQAPLPDDPCVKICVRDRYGDICLGCGRTEKEIQNWTKYTPSQQTEILTKTDARLDVLTEKRREKRKTRHRAKDALKDA